MPDGRSVRWTYARKVAAIEDADRRFDSARSAMKAAEVKMHEAQADLINADARLTQRERDRYYGGAGLKGQSGAPKPGQVWRNKHTGKWVKVYAVDQEARTRPTRIAQAPDRRLIMFDHEPYTATMVRFEGGAPPGFDDRTVGGWELEQWLEHWDLDDFPGAA